MIIEWRIAESLFLSVDCPFTEYRRVSQRTEEAQSPQQLGGLHPFHDLAWLVLEVVGDVDEGVLEKIGSGRKTQYVRANSL